MLGIDRIQLAYDCLCRGVIDLRGYRRALRLMLQKELLGPDDYRTGLLYGAVRRCGRERRAVVG